MSTAKRLGVLLAVLVAIAGVAAPAAALSSSGVYGSWQGTANFASEVSGGLQLVVAVDYAVYAPGAFPYAGYTAAANEFVYAYQVHLPSSLAGADPTEMVKFTVTMLDSNEANDIGWFNLAGGVAPSTSFFGNTPPNLSTANWDYQATPNASLIPGESSVGLVYSSVNEPLWTAGITHDGGLQAQALVPSPSNAIPEPGVVGLLGLALLAIARRARA